MKDIPTIYDLASIFLAKNRMQAVNNDRVYLYVDGCNLCSGMRQNRLYRCYWLDLVSLGDNFLREGQNLIKTKYFTARVRGNVEKSRRHSIYITALMTCANLEVIEGQFLAEPVFCGNCGHRRPVPKEKQTDTNIATEMVCDAFFDCWDTAFLISGDSDLVPPIRKIRHHFPHKKILVAFPPSRQSSDLKAAASGSFHINTAQLVQNQLPDHITTPEVELKRPEKRN